MPYFSMSFIWTSQPRKVRHIFQWVLFEPHSPERFVISFNEFYLNLTAQKGSSYLSMSFIWTSQPRKVRHIFQWVLFEPHSPERFVISFNEFYLNLTAQKGSSYLSMNFIWTSQPRKVWSFNWNSQPRKVRHIFQWILFEPHSPERFVISFNEFYLNLTAQKGSSYLSMNFIWTSQPRKVWSFIWTSQPRKVRHIFQWILFEPHSPERFVISFNEFYLNLTAQKGSSYLSMNFIWTSQPRKVWSFNWNSQPRKVRHIFQWILFEPHSPERFVISFNEFYLNLTAQKGSSYLSMNFIWTSQPRKVWNTFQWVSIETHSPERFVISFNEFQLNLTSQKGMEF